MGILEFVLSCFKGLISLNASTLGHVLLTSHIFKILSSLFLSLLYGDLFLFLIIKRWNLWYLWFMFFRFFFSPFFDVVLLCFYYMTLFFWFIYLHSCTFFTFTCSLRTNCFDLILKNLFLILWLPIIYFCLRKVSIFLLLGCPIWLFIKLHYLMTFISFSTLLH